MTFSKGNLFKPNAWKSLIFGIAYFIACFFLLSVYRIKGQFCDEYDNLTGAMSIVHGGELYKDYISQHMPMMYYLCSLFRMLGADTLLLNRLFFYAFLSLIWVIMYFRYSKEFGKLTLCLYPLGYVFLMGNIDDMSHMILSEQMQAQSFVILLFEFLFYLKYRKIKAGGAAAISFAVLFSFGVAFVSIFAVATIVIGVIFIEVTESFRETHRISSTFQKTVKLLWKPVIASAIPFIVMGIYYLATDNLRNAYMGAYSINTNVYSKYVGGFGDSILKTLLSTVDNYFLQFKNSFNSFSSSITSTICVLTNVISNVAFIILMNRKKTSYAVIISIFILVTGMRGYAGFHAVPYWAVSLVMALLLLQEYRNQHVMECTVQKKRVVALALCVTFIGFSLGSNYFQQFSTIVIEKEDFEKPVYDTNTYEYYINKLTNQDEEIFVGTLDFQLFFNTERKSATSDLLGSVAPWIDEVYGEQTLQELEEASPRIAIFSPDYSLWGYIYKDYASDITGYILDHYTKLEANGLTMLYVRNDYYDEALHILQMEVPMVSESGCVAVIGPIESGHRVSQVFRSTGYDIYRIKIDFATYARTNRSSMTMNITDLTTEKKVYTGSIDVASLDDNALASIDLPNIHTEADHVYEVSFSAEGTTDSDFITIYHSEDGTATDDFYAIIDGEVQSFSLCFYVYGDEPTT